MGDPSCPTIDLDTHHAVAHVPRDRRHLGSAGQLGQHLRAATCGRAQLGVGGGVIGAGAGCRQVQHTLSTRAKIHAPLGEPRRRVVRRAVEPRALPDLQMQVRRRGGARIAHQGDGLSGVDRLSDPHMRVGIPHVVVGAVKGLPIDLML